MTKSNLVKKEFVFWLILPGHSSSLREIKAGSEAETMEEYCLLTYVLDHAEIYISQTHLRADGATHSGLALPQQLSQSLTDMDRPA